MTIRIGANPICWANDDMPELGGDTALEAIQSEAKQIGFEGLELGKRFPNTPEALTAALPPYGLACISGWHSGELLTRDPDAEANPFTYASRGYANLITYLQQAGLK